MSTYLVTGAQGFLGRFLVAQLLASDPDAKVVGLGRSPRNDESFTHHILLGKRHVEAPLTEELAAASRDPRYSYLSLDLQQAPKMITTLRGLRPQVVFHLASALRDDAVDSLFDINVVGSVRLLEALVAAQLDNPRVVFVSSGGVYGIPEAGKLPLDESTPCRPNDLYSISKWSAESAIGLIARQMKIPLVVGRVFNVLGPGQDERHVCGRIMSQLSAIGAGAWKEPVQIGALETTRDFIDVRDVASATALLGEKGAPGEIYNVASGVETSIGEVLDLSLKLTSLEGKAEVRRGPPRPADIPRHFGDIRRLKALGYAPRYSLSDSLEAILAYYQKCWGSINPPPIK